MKIEEQNTKDLIPYARNSRTHSEAQVSQIAGSIKEFGFTNPVLIDAEGGIIAGHGRILAAQKLGLDRVPCITLGHLTEAQRKAYVIADNKLALNAGWDDEMLALELEELSSMDFDLSITGFDEEEIAGLLVETTEGETDPDDVPEVEGAPISVEGDVWLLGRHRLMCGDSTSIDAVEKLMNEARVDMVFTDPPYNVAFNGRSGKHDVIKNDDLRAEEFRDFIDSTLDVIRAVEPEVYYIWCNWDFYGILQGKMDYKACIVWAKNVFGMGSGYRHQHEFCLFNGRIDNDIKNESDLWMEKKDTNYMHPTQKPVELSVRAIGNHSGLVNILDLFGGSGSTLIGAEKTGRSAYLMELDPKYCDVIVKRWQNFTGKQATHEETGKTFEEMTQEAG